MNGQNAIGSIKLGSMQSSCAFKFCKPRDAIKTAANTSVKNGLLFFMVEFNDVNWVYLSCYRI
jgi:hypothetical protein